MFNALIVQCFTFKGGIGDKEFNISEINKKKKEIIEEKLINEKFILSVGRLTYQKNHKILINAFKEVSINYPELKLVILGDGEKEDELLNLIKNLFFH